MTRKKGAPRISSRLKSSKAEQIFSAAEAVFLDVGYGAASMESVAARANVSKSTIYGHFENKQMLFDAIIRRRAEPIFGGQDVPLATADIRQRLLDLATSYVMTMLSPGAVSMYRAVLAEASQQPDIGQAFYLAGPTRAQRQLNDYFGALAERGLPKLGAADAPLVADLFMSMLAGDSHVRALCNQPPDEVLFSKICAMAVDLVMTRYS